MINYKDKLDDVDKKDIEAILSQYTDFYSDFYITKENLRIFLKENISELFNAIENGDKIAYSQSGVVVTYGLSSKYRTYIKVIGKDIDNELKTLLWSIGDQVVYAKLKKNNELLPTFYKYNFKAIGFRGKELLLKRGI